MFQLIVAVISIALVAALAIASIYYGGSAFQQSSLRANVVTLVNGGQQIAGAAALYRTDFGGVNPSNMAALTTNGQYLSAEPGFPAIAVNGWAIDGNTAEIELAPGVAATVCPEVQRQANGPWADAQFGCTDGAGSAAVAGTSHFSFRL